MLAAEDRALVSRDPQVPGLGTVLDGDELQARLYRALPGLGVRAVHVEYVRYKPATSCTVGLRLDTDEGELRGHAKAHRRGDEAKAAKTLAKVDRAPARARATVLDDLVAVALLPADPALPVVGRLAEPVRRRRLLHKVLPDAEPYEGLTVLRYKPGRRAVVRVDGRDGPLGVLRCLDSGGFVAARRAIRAVDGAHLPLSLPPLLHVSARHRLVVVGWIPAEGTLEQAWAAQDGAVEDLLRTTGALLARLHGSRVPRLPPDDGHDRAALAAARRSVGVVCPALADEVGALADRLDRRLRGRWAATAGSVTGGRAPRRGIPIHGDFSADQVLLRANGPALVDLDAMRTGDPAVDLGSFAAQLIAEAVRTGRTPIRAEAALALLVEGHAGDHAGVATHVAAYLLRRAAEPFRRRWPDWSRATAALVAEATRWADA